MISSFGRQSAPEAEAGLHVRAADPRVGREPGEHLADVRPGFLAQRGDLVGERQLEGQERIRPVLDDLCRLDVDDQARGLDRVVDGHHRVERGRISIREPSDDDPGRVGEILDRAALA